MGFLASSGLRLVSDPLKSYRYDFLEIQSWKTSLTAFGDNGYHDDISSDKDDDRNYNNDGDRSIDDVVLQLLEL